ncbi:MAG: hypothetical protein QOG19_1469 [Mycobacterium sp.]|nr:hypothetical protein [Mycobacterium sp.]MDT5224062.1 hypothetical protein [Mycobacterium sp.]
MPDFDTGEEPLVPEFDTGEPSVPFVPNFDDTDSQPFLPLVGLGEPAQDSKAAAKPAGQPNESKQEPALASPSAAVAADSAPDTPGPVAVPGRYLYLKWWKLILVLFGVWFFAAVFGLSLYYWWFHTIDKTPPVFASFVYVVACTVAGLILAMVEAKPLIAALAIAVMSAPFASVGAAAPLYGSYYCDRGTTPCVLGVIPD